MLQGAPNFRDVGALRTLDGRTLRTGALLRSGHLGSLQPQDLELLRERLGSDVRVIDLRSDPERARIGCNWPEAVVRALPIEPTVARRLDALVAAGQAPSAQIAQAYMRDAYENFVHKARPQLAELLNQAIERAGRPLVVHCAQGKDRTGFMIAMVLLALHVPRDQVMADYLLTNQRVAPATSGRYSTPVMEVLGRVQADYLQAALDAIDRDFGDVGNYLAKAAALTPARRARLRTALLRRCE